MDEPKSPDLSGLVGDKTQLNMFNKENNMITYIKNRSISIPRVMHRQPWSYLQK